LELAVVGGGGAPEAIDVQRVCWARSRKGETLFKFL
jgi:hypothetical protein